VAKRFPGLFTCRHESLASLCLGESGSGPATVGGRIAETEPEKASYAWSCVASRVRG
jgi:hypothetical protein